MTTFNPDEEVLSSIASLSHSLSRKSGTLDIHNISNPITLEVNTAPEPTSIEIPLCSSTQIPTVYTQPLCSTLKTRHSLTPPPPDYLEIINDNHPIPPKKKYNILEDPVFFDSGILPPSIHLVKNPSQTNTMTDEYLRTHPNFNANLPSLYMTPTTYKFRFPQACNVDHYVACASKLL